MKQIHLSGKDRDKFVLVDDDDFNALCRHRWYLAKNGYVQRMLPRVYKDGKKIKRPSALIHRDIMNVTSRLEYVDHINGNKLDNRRSNLRVANPSESNSYVPKRLIKNVTSRYKGVSWSNTSKKWRVRITKNGKENNFGTFPTEESAARVYNDRAKVLFGDFAFLNRFN